jgi:hypothetical protein
MQMSKQVNIYLMQGDIEKIQKYLLDRNFVLIKDEIRELPKPIYADNLLRYPARAAYLSFPETALDYYELQTEGTQKYRIKGIRTEVMTFDLLAMTEEHFRVRFFYCPYYFENHEKKFKNPEFTLHIDRICRLFITIPIFRRKNGFENE